MGKQFYRVLRIAVAAVVLILTGIAFYGGGRTVAEILHFQFGPALMRCFAAFSAGALAAVLAILVLTLLFGRIYCSVFCPFGILQDLILVFSRRKNCKVPNLPGVRYAVAGIVFGLLFCGWSAGFLLLDPYTNAGRIAGAFTAGGFVPLIIILALVLWKRRIYCTAICPVGTLLGLTAKFSIFRPVIQEGCVKCGKCARLCPAGCIDVKSGAIDNERCLRCMNCIAGCPFSKIRFEMKKTEEIPVNGSRRALRLVPHLQKPDSASSKSSRGSSGFFRPEREVRNGSLQNAQAVSSAQETVRRKSSFPRKARRVRSRLTSLAGHAGSTATNARASVRPEPSVR